MTIHSVRRKRRITATTIELGHKLRRRRKPGGICVHRNCWNWNRNCFTPVLVVVVNSCWNRNGNCLLTPVSVVVVVVRPVLATHVMCCIAAHHVLLDEYRPVAFASQEDLLVHEEVMLSSNNVLAYANVVREVHLLLRSSGQLMLVVLQDQVLADSLHTPKVKRKPGGICVMHRYAPSRAFRPILWDTFVSVCGDWKWAANFQLTVLIMCCAWWCSGRCALLQLSPCNYAQLPHRTRSTQRDLDYANCSVHKLQGGNVVEHVFALH